MRNVQSPTSRNDASGNEFEALHDKIQEQLVMEDMPTSSKSMKWRIQLVRMVSELAMRFQQEQKYCNDETQRLKQMLSQQQQLTTTPSKNESPGQSRQLQRLRKVASRMHKEILILREKVKRTEAESKSKDEKISELVEESQKNVWRIETSEKRVKDMETQLAIKSSNLEAALTSSLSIAESHAAAERRIAEMERQLATGYTNLRREIDRTVMGSPSENSNNKNNGSHQWSRFGMGEIDKEKTTMIPATTRDEPLLIVSELRDMLLDLWNQLHQVAEASSLMSGAPETIEDLENWCKTHPESELTMRGIERVMFWSLGGKHDFDDFLRALCFSKGSDVSVLLPPASSDDGDDDKKWYDRKPTNIDLTTKNRRPAKQLTMPPPPQKEKGAELHARHTALSRRAEEFISGLTSKATTTNSRVVYSVDSPRQMNNGSYNADMTLEPRLREIAVSIRELQEWSLRLRGRKEVEAISNSLARVIIGFMHAVELYMTRPRNVEVVSATVRQIDYVFFFLCTHFYHNTQSVSQSVTHTHTHSLTHPNRYLNFDDHFEDLKTCTNSFKSQHLSGGDRHLENIFIQKSYAPSSCVVVCQIYVRELVLLLLNFVEVDVVWEWLERVSILIFPSRSWKCFQTQRENLEMFRTRYVSVLDMPTTMQ
jgi:hypothetical protein